jgi:hypothetical protein
MGIILSSCGEVKQIGQLELLSTKSSTVTATELLASPTYSKKDIRKKAEDSIDEAIDKELTKYPGASHMANVRIYQVEKLFGYKYSVQGEIIGTR